MLIIIDDFITDINKDKNSKEIYTLIFNRRHLLVNGILKY